MALDCLHVGWEVGVNLVSDDPAARQAISIQFVCSNHPDCGQGAAGSEEEGFVERTKFVTVDGKKFRVRMRTFEEGQKIIFVKKGQQNADRDAFGSEGFIIQTPFFPGRIWISATNGDITVLQSDTSYRDTYLTIPLNVGPATSCFPRKLVPGTSVAFMACNAKFVCAEQLGIRALRANRGAVTDWETFTVVQKNGTDNRFGLRAAINDKYVSYAAGWLLVADRTELSDAECFIEVDAGCGKVALITANDSMLYVGGGEILSLVPEMNDWEKFAVLVINSQ